MATNSQSQVGVQSPNCAAPGPITFLNGATPPTSATFYATFSNILKQFIQHGEQSTTESNLNQNVSQQQQTATAFHPLINPNNGLQNGNNEIKSSLSPNNWNLQIPTSNLQDFHQVLMNCGPNQVQPPAAHQQFPNCYRSPVTQGNFPINNQFLQSLSYFFLPQQVYLLQQQVQNLQQQFQQLQHQLTYLSQFGGQNGKSKEVNSMIPKNMESPVKAQESLQGPGYNFLQNACRISNWIRNEEEVTSPQNGNTENRLSAH